jgi:hypothetical protein
VIAIVPSHAVSLGAELVPTAGVWERSGGETTFTPRFATVPGTTYVVVGRGEDRAEAWRELARAEVPVANRASSTAVVAIDPSVGEVPANLLRFAVTFSAAMSDGSAARHIHLLDENGAELPGALLEMPPELWDRDRRSLTVLLEPGRIKRGLQPNLQAGAPLQDGDTVTLVVDSGILDAAGSSLVRGATRSYAVGAAIRSRVDPHRWKVRWPDASSRELTVVFDRPLDRALVQRYLRVVDETGQPVPGHSALDEDSLRWVFTPADVHSGIRVRVDARLEDLAGNSVRRVFDRDLDESADDEIDDAALILSPGAR